LTAVALAFTLHSFSDGAAKVVCAVTPLMNILTRYALSSGAVRQYKNELIVFVKHERR
jgi:hypothetical protein